MSSKNSVFLALWVYDYDVAIDFYCERARLFGIRANTSGPGLRNVVLDHLGATNFGLLIHLADTPEMLSLVGKQGGESSLMILPVQDCYEARASMLAKGVVFVGETIELPYGIQAKIEDPFGNQITLFERFRL